MKIKKVIMALPLILLLSCDGKNDLSKTDRTSPIISTHQGEEADNPNIVQNTDSPSPDESVSLQLVAPPIIPIELTSPTNINVTRSTPQILFKDDFESSDVSLWKKSPEWAVVDDGLGKKVFRQSYDAGGPSAEAGSEKWADYTFDFDITPLNLTDTLIISLRANSSGDKYMLYLTNERLSLNKYKSSVLKNLTSINQLWNNNQTYNFKIILTGGLIDVYVDGNKKISYTDASNYIPKGKIGFSTRFSSMQVDNVLVTDNTMFFDDFTDGDTVGWTLSKSWVVGKDSLNNVLRQPLTIIGSFPVEAGLSEWRDYSFEGILKPMLLTKRYQVDFRINSKGDRYSLHLLSNKLEMHKTVKNLPELLKSIPMTFTNGSLYKFRIDAVGGMIQVFLNGKKIIFHHDLESPILGGKIGFTTVNSSLQIDNVKVSAADISLFDKIDGIGSTGVIVDQPASQNQTVASVADFGAKPENADSRAQFQAAIDYCQKNKISKLIVPKGTYYFRSTTYPGGILDFRNLKDFTFDGGGSTFIYGVDATFMIISNNERLKFTNYTVDWDWSIGRIGSIAKIVGVNMIERSADLNFPQYAEVPLDLRLSNFYPIDPVSFKPGFEDAVDFNLPRFKSVKRISPNTLRYYYGQYTPSFLVGQTFMIRHYGVMETPSGQAHAAFFTSHLIFENVVIHSAIGACFDMRLQVDHVMFDNVQVISKPNSDRYMSSARDGIGLFNSAGHLIIRNSRFEYLYDDVLNISNFAGLGLSVINSTTIKANNNSSYYVVGDKIEFRNSDMFKIGSGLLYTIASANFDSIDNKWTLIFTTNLPVLDSKTIVINKRFGSNYIIENNYFGSRPRVLVLYEGNGTIRNNIFEDINFAAIQFETNISQEFNDWNAGTGVNNVLVSGNTFKNAGYRGMGAIYFQPTRNINSSFFTNMLFVNNTFAAIPQKIFNIQRGENIFIVNNSIAPTSKATNYVDRSATYVEKSSNVYFQYNSILGTPSFSGYTLITGAEVINATDRSNFVQYP